MKLSDQMPFLHLTRVAQVAAQRYSSIDVWANK
jgi:hypothetical protein